MHSLKPSATAQPANFTAGATAGRLLAHPATAASGSCSYPMDDATAVAVAAPALPNDRLGEDLSATAMSIDTPSYARSLGMGQLGSAAGFAASLFQGSQDLAQSMSIDGVQADLVSGQAAASSGAGRHNQHVSGLPSYTMYIWHTGQSLCVLQCPSPLCNGVYMVCCLLFVAFLCSAFKLTSLLPSLLHRFGVLRLDSALQAQYPQLGLLKYGPFSPTSSPCSCPPAPRSLTPILCASSLYGMAGLVFPGELCCIMLTHYTYRRQNTVRLNVRTEN